MPYEVVRNANICPAGNPWAVIKQGVPGTALGCHATQGDAQKQLAALYANEPGASRMNHQTEQQQTPARGDGHRLEQREFTVEVRSADDGMLTLAGYASTSNDPYPVRDLRWGEFEETILPGAWADTLREADDIHLLVGHGAIPIPLAARAAGSLRLTEDTHGLAFEADINPTRSSLHGDVAYAVESGAMRQMSVGMRIPKDGDRWDDQTESAKQQRYISRADLLEISVLTRGANSNTSAMMRSEDDLLDEIRHLTELLAVRRESPGETEDRYLAGLTRELAKMNARRYPS